MSGKIVFFRLDTYNSNNTQNHEFWKFGDHMFKFAKLDLFIYYANLTNLSNITNITNITNLTNNTNISNYTI